MLTDNLQSTTQEVCIKTLPSLNSLCLSHQDSKFGLNSQIWALFVFSRLLCACVREWTRGRAGRPAQSGQADIFRPCRPNFSGVTRANGFCCFCTVGLNHAGRPGRSGRRAKMAIWSCSRRKRIKIHKGKKDGSITKRATCFHGIPSMLERIFNLLLFVRKNSRAFLKGQYLEDAQEPVGF